jgi:Flp pilus assembly protein TadG
LSTFFRPIIRHSAATSRWRAFVADSRAVGFYKKQSGAAMVEFAIAASIFTLLLLGILQFGYAAWVRNCIAADAREGARYAIVRGSQSGRNATSAEVISYVKTRTSLDQTITVTPQWEFANHDPGTLVTITVSHALPRFLNLAATASASSSMLIVY